MRRRTPSTFRNRSDRTAALPRYCFSYTAVGPHVLAQATKRFGMIARSIPKPGDAIDSVSPPVIVHVPASERVVSAVQTGRPPGPAEHELLSAESVNVPSI